MNIREVSGGADIRRMTEVAAIVWREANTAFCTPEQVEYMIEMFQSVRAIKEQLARGYTYVFVKANGEPVGFMAFYPRGDAMYLSKLYLRADMRGRGFARDMIGCVRQQAERSGLHAIELNVNKHNKTTEIYDKLGFTRIRDEKNDIGSGFYMDDYVYRLEW